MSTRIRRLYIRDFQQFRDTLLDFTDPNTGEAARRICLIGRNGTGKTTLLRLLDSFLTHGGTPAEYGFLAELDTQDGRLFCIDPPYAYRRIPPSPVDLRDFPQIGKKTELRRVFDFMEPDFNRVDVRDHLPVYTKEHPGGLLAVMSAEHAVNNTLAFRDVPATNLNTSLELARNFGARQEISNDTVADMWSLLVYLVKQRESDRQGYENLPGNLDKTKKQLIAEFDAQNPPVLDRLAKLWDRILAPVGLEFDIENARLPIQLTDNLHAYIRRKDTKEEVPYHALSTGIRNFLFRFGHLYLLYFNRNIQNGFVLIDEPEDSLFPDFQFELMDVLGELVGETTQMFVATHSPIIAAQFEPHERIVLDFDDDLYVTASKGKAPQGDDPNDVLRQDFGLPEVMGPAGIAAWERYVELRTQLRHAPEEQKPTLLEEAADLGRRYGF